MDILSFSAGAVFGFFSYYAWSVITCSSLGNFVNLEKLGSRHTAKREFYRNTDDLGPTDDLGSTVKLVPLGKESPKVKPSKIFRDLAKSITGDDKNFNGIIEMFSQIIDNEKGSYTVSSCFPKAKDQTS